GLSTATATQNHKCSRHCHNTSTSTQTAPSKTSPLSLHDALPIWARHLRAPGVRTGRGLPVHWSEDWAILGGERTKLQVAQSSLQDRKSTRLNSSHVKISYAVFCLKKKKIANDMTSWSILTVDYLF